MDCIASGSLKIDVSLVSVKEGDSMKRSVSNRSLRNNLVGAKLNGWDEGLEEGALSKLGLLEGDDKDWAERLGDPEGEGDDSVDGCDEGPEEGAMLKLGLAGAKVGVFPIQNPPSGRQQSVQQLQRTFGWGEPSQSARNDSKGVSMRSQKRFSTPPVRALLSM
jgi:hypothetical protein